MTDLTADEADRSRLLYGILAGLLHDKGKRLLKSVQHNNGFDAYRLLSKDLTPCSRNRILALLQTLHAWPQFDNKSGLMVQLAKFESAVSEYETLSGAPMNDDSKLAAVLRCLSGQLRTQATVLITESSTYQDLRNLIERWDSSQTRWGASLATSFGIAPPGPPGGVAPMEVDRVQKGKGKDKGGKDKGKGGKQREGKGKGGKQREGKGKGGKQPKGKGKGGNSSGKSGQPGKRVCHYCERPGHLERDCWLKQKHGKGRVNQVSEVSPGDSASQTAASSTAAPPSVRRVQVFDLGDTSSLFAGGTCESCDSRASLESQGNPVSHRSFCKGDF